MRPSWELQSAAGGHRLDALAIMNMHSPDETPSTSQEALAYIALFALGVMFLFRVALGAFVDPDVWHEAALFREALTLGRLPLEDRFAYTPTVYPVIHHEWGTGAILYYVVRYGGAAGLLSLKYLLTLGIAVGCFHCARRRGANLAVLCPLVAVAIFTGWIGFSTVRAQMFTLVLTVGLLYFLDRDREGARWWIAPWLVLYVIWVNLHGGFVIAGVLLVLHTVEQAVRRKPIRHLGLVVATMTALVAVNPYGLAYYSYLWRALRLSRPLVTEWSPICAAYPSVFAVYGLSLALLVYAAYRLGFARVPGFVVVAFLAYAAARHQRHVSLYALAWLCYVPAYMQETRLGEWLTNLWTRRARTALTGWALVGAVCLAGLVGARPWHLRMPVNKGEHSVLIYPVGAVAYLERVGFRGNLLVPFHVGAYVTWKLHPNVKVSIDGRFEVAYPPNLLDEHLAFYDAESEWQLLLSRYPTDAVLVPTSSKVCSAMPQLGWWRRVYRDNVYEVYVRAGTDLPRADLRGRRFLGTFP